MKNFKKLTGFMCALVLMTSSVQAADRLDQNEIHRFLKQMDVAISSSDLGHMQDFLSYNVSTNASFENSIDWAHNRFAYGYGHDYYGWNGYNRVGYNSYLAHEGRYHDAWATAGVNPYYYRYPYYGRNGFVPTATRNLDRVQLINHIDGKKRAIPGYAVDTKVLKIKMPANAMSAVVDVNFKEFGLTYAGYGYGYRQGLSNDALLANSSCKVYLNRQQGRTVLTRMACNTVSAIR